MALSNRSSSVVLAVCCVAALFAVPLVGAISTTPEEVPESAEVGTQVSATVLVSDLYRDPNLESWTMTGETDLTEVTWTLTLLDQGGNQLTTQSYDGPTFEQGGITLEEGVSEVRVKVTGTVPPVTNYQYNPQQSFTLINLTQTREGGTSSSIGDWSAFQFTQESQSAREAIEQAQAAIETADSDGANIETAEETLQDAIEAYETRSFNLATSLAGEAESEARSAQESTQRNRWLLYGTIGVMVVGGIIGALYWYQTREERYDRLG